MIYGPFIEPQNIQQGMSNVEVFSPFDILRSSPDPIGYDPEIMNAEQGIFNVEVFSSL
jgi:hypothetical protein